MSNKTEQDRPHVNVGTIGHVGHGKPSIRFLVFGMPGAAEVLKEMFLGDGLPDISFTDGFDIMLEPMPQKVFKLEAHEPMDLSYLLPEPKPLHPYGPAHRRGKGKMRKFA